MASGTYLKEGKAGLGSEASENTLIGFFGRVSYAYDNRYNLLVSVRREGSSKFGADNKWGTFPSASLGWTISNEQFMKGLTWLNNLKLRAGFGITGVIPNDPYQSLTRYAYETYYKDGDTWKQGLKVQSNPNAKLKWENLRNLMWVWTGVYWMTVWVVLSMYIIKDYRFAVLVQCTDSSKPV